jgi:hypothetical protein
VIALRTLGVRVRHQLFARDAVLTQQPPFHTKLHTRRILDLRICSALSRHESLGSRNRRPGGGLRLGLTRREVVTLLATPIRSSRDRLEFQCLSRQPMTREETEREATEIRRCLRPPAIVLRLLPVDALLAPDLSFPDVAV